MNTRERILATADELFAQVGYDAASTREIAERSGVNKALIHYHFKNKEALLGSVLEAYYERLGAMLGQMIGVSGPFRERMVALVSAYLDFLNENRNFSRIVQREMSGGANLDLIRDRMKPLFVLGRRMLEAEYPATCKGPLAADQLLLSFFGVIVSYFSYAEVVSDLLGKDPLSPAALRRRRAHVLAVLDTLIAAVEAQGKG
jgi:TetR/AcrR family transcriptional regulator